MALDIGIPVVEQRKLFDVDPSGETWVRIRQARHREEIERLKVLFTPQNLPYQQQMTRVRELVLSYEEPDDELSRLFDEVLKLMTDVQRAAPGVLLDELYALECRLTFEESNMEMGGDILFTSGMKHDHAAFEEAYAKLPYPVAQNWQKEVWEVNPDWTPFPLRREPAESESESPSENT